MPVPLFQLRAATSEDGERVYAISRDAMRSYVEQTWVAGTRSNNGADT
jgi:hypothetical protein